MFTRPVLAFAALLLVAPGCGPESEALPPSGIYRMTAVTLENDCHPKLDDDYTGEEVVHVTPEWIKVPHVDFLGISETCEACVALAGYRFMQVKFDPEAGEYASEVQGGGCMQNERVEVETVDGETVRSRLTADWRDDGSCAWAGEGCTVVREYTYELVEPCDDCEFPLHQGE
ncbi:hypothetical protein OV203_39420 [Nannocystis sp. ILAH1]|uniref:hypothetical protein n=1 Tax=unclassified Nannocystis TaxID=2627009 RepID=UPI00226D8151|nr:MULTISPECIES: hypothetical protein [unclassified Nannocystis]MCY0993275.1 hypothetical protein [Nannocystis sp. ILAH1]MCY1063292.1 hypothetical protein [Nannocystis sp. RBIL2]